MELVVEIVLVEGDVGWLGYEPVAMLGVCVATLELTDGNDMTGCLSDIERVQPSIARQFAALDHGVPDT